MVDRSILSRILLLSSLAVFLTACGGDDDPKATAPTNPLPTSDSQSDPTTSATLGAGEVTAGSIADRISAAWATVTSYTATTRVFTAGATPVATPGVEYSGTAVRTVILPDQKRVLISDGNGTLEIILSDGVIQQRQTPFDGQPGDWVTIDPTSIADDDPFAVAYASILAPEQPPYSALSDRQRDRIGTEEGTLEINGRVCSAYGFPEVTLTGEQIRITIYIGADDLPCRIETLAGLSVSQTDYVFNQETAIATPLAQE